VPCKMKSILGIFLFIVLTVFTGVKGFSYGEDGGPEEILDVLDYQMEPRFFNFSIDSIFNDSLLTLGGIFIVGVILFEVALYALDVYYNQTYLNRNDNRNDGGQFPTNQEQQYYDYYQQTFRSFEGGSSWRNIAKIPQWLALAYEMYETSSEVLSDVDCTKKAICEIYQNSQELGQLGQRAMHGLDMMESLSYMSLPDEFFNILDEFMDAQTEGRTREVQCQELYPTCPKSLTELSRMYNHI